jgi:hypothetical protein
MVPVVSRLFWSSRAPSGVGARVVGAVTTTSRFAPVLPSMIVTVTALVVFVCGAGDTIAGAARSAESTRAAACGTDTSSGPFFAMRRSAGATATGSPPEGSRPTTAHNTKRPRNRPSATAMICTAAMLTAPRRFLGPCPSGSVRSFAVIRHPVRRVARRSFTALFLCGPAQHANCRAILQHGESRERAYHAVHSHRPFTARRSLVAPNVGRHCLGQTRTSKKIGAAHGRPGFKSTIDFVS